MDFLRVPSTGQQHGAGSAGDSLVVSSSHGVQSNHHTHAHHQNNHNQAAQQLIISSQGQVGGSSSSSLFTGNILSGLGSTMSGNSDSGPILYMEPNRTSAIEDIRSVIIYISFATLLLGFLIIFPGIRHDKIPTFLCIPTSLVVTCIIFAALTGTTWHVSEAPISAAYKAFSRDRIQGELSVKIGLQSVNITLRAHKYYILHATHGPMMMDNLAPSSMVSSMSSSSSLSSPSSSVPPPSESQTVLFSSLADTSTMTTSDVTVDPLITENPFTQPALASEVERSEVDEAFESSSETNKQTRTIRQSLSNRGQTLATTTRNSTRSSVPKRRNNNTNINTNNNDTKPSSSSIQDKDNNQDKLTTTNFSTNFKINKQDSRLLSATQDHDQHSSKLLIKGQKYSIKRINVDINYNERFYWIEPNQMRQEHHNALKRGLPYPILTVVEYLSQDEAGFSWSRQYRLAGYYAYIQLSLTLCLCALMFLFHCAAPEYAIYTLQLIGCLLLLTNFTYAMLVPRGDQSLVIPFEGESLTFDFGFDFWLVLIGGCLSLFIGSLLAIINYSSPLTTILDHDFDTNNGYYRHRKRKIITINNNDDVIDNKYTAAGQLHGSKSPISLDSNVREGGSLPYLAMKRLSRSPFDLGHDSTKVHETNSHQEHKSASLNDDHPSKFINELRNNEVPITSDLHHQTDHRRQQQHQEPTISRPATILGQDNNHANNNKNIQTRKKNSKAKLHQHSPQVNIEGQTTAATTPTTTSSYL